MIVLLVILLSFGQPDCWDTYWECSQPARDTLDACTEPCYDAYSASISPCEITCQYCDVLENWRPFIRCMTGPEPDMFYFLRYEIHRDEEEQVEWVEQVIVPVGQPYECRVKCDHDNDGDVDMFDVAQEFSYSSVRNCVAKGEGTLEECEEKFKTNE